MHWNSGFRSIGRNGMTDYCKEEAVEKRIGFVGCYSHDIILLLAKVFECVEKKVLIRDFNKRHILRSSLPIPECIDPENEDAEYDGVFFTERKTVGSSDDYEIELIDFGTETDDYTEQWCTDWIVITDMLPHHIRRFAEADIPKEKTRVCIVRDAFEEVCKKEPEIIQLLNSFCGAKSFFLPPDYRDVRNRYVCETSHEYSVNRASPELQDMIYRIADMFYEDLSEREIRRKVKRRERRRYR